MALRLFLHAFKTIFRNWKEALTISIIPLGLLIVVALLFGTTFSGYFSPIDSGNTAVIGLGAFVFILAFCFATAFIAASWHRFVLLEETPKLLGSPAMGRTLPYIGNSILLGLWLILFLLPLMLIVGFITAGFSGESVALGSTSLNYGWKDMLFEIVVGTIVGAIVFMYSLILPASAIGQLMTFRASRLAAMKLGGDLLVLSFLMAMFNTLPTFVLNIIPSGPAGIVAAIISLAIQWLTLMVGISILTTLYGHLVEGRDLPA